MSITLGNNSFTGPFGSIENLKDKPGVFAVICKEGTEYFLIDVGESYRVRTSIQKNLNNACWTNNCNGGLIFYVHYSSFLKQEGRRLIENELRELFHPSCKIKSDPESPDTRFKFLLYSL